MGEGWCAEIVLKEEQRICLRGAKKAILESCHCSIDGLNREAHSLNEAYSLVSTEYEPERRSHTGSVFQKGLYLDGKVWLQLDIRRQQMDAQLEQEIIRTKSRRNGEPSRSPQLPFGP